MKMTDQEIIELEKQHVMQTYKRSSVVFERGEGVYVYDTHGKKYLDFVGGVACNPLGHANPELAQAITEQANTLISVSNLYYSQPQVLLAQKLAKLSGLQKAFFCHSGTDANEAAIKLAKRTTGKHRFIAFTGSFHGRTSGSLALTWKPAFREPFEPLSPAVDFAEYGDADSAKKLITKDTAAIIVEPIQGEAGIVVPPEGFLKSLREICNEASILLIVDEVQTGMGRTGTFFAYEQEGIKPDIVTLAKGLANGVPIGVCLSDLDFQPGDHGATLGGNNLSCVAALATIDYIETHRLLNNAGAMGAHLLEMPGARGKGLMIGLELKQPHAVEVVKAAQGLGLLCTAPTETVIRLLPPLIVTKQQVDEALGILQKAVAQC